MSTGDLRGQVKKVKFRENRYLLVQSVITPRVLQIETPDKKQQTLHSLGSRMIPILTTSGSQARSGQVKSKVSSRKPALWWPKYETYDPEFRKMNARFVISAKNYPWVISRSHKVILGHQRSSEVNDLIWPQSGHDLSGTHARDLFVPSLTPFDPWRAISQKKSAICLRTGCAIDEIWPFDLTSEVTSWHKTLKLGTNGIVSWRAARSFFSAKLYLN